MPRMTIEIEDDEDGEMPVVDLREMGLSRPDPEDLLINAVGKAREAGLSKITALEAVLDTYRAPWGD